MSKTFEVRAANEDAVGRSRGNIKSFISVGMTAAEFLRKKFENTENWYCETWNARITEKECRQIKERYRTTCSKCLAHRGRDSSHVK